MLDTQLLIAAIGAISAILTAYMSYLWQTKKEVDRQLDAYKKEIEFKQDTFDLSDFLIDWNRFYWELQKLMSETVLDRFLILRAWNGVIDPRFTTAVLQIRQGNQSPVSYIHVELDNDYVDKLMRIKARGHEYFIVDQENDSLIKRIYQAEGVKAALWVYLESKEHDGSVRMSYCSFATHDDRGFTECEITRMVLLFGQLKGVVNL
jgi:hypothetical protein